MIVVLGFLVVIAAGGLVWWFAIASRKRYECPLCGNSFVVEHMEATSCNVCGAPVRNVQ